MTNDDLDKFADFCIARNANQSPEEALLTNVAALLLVLFEIARRLPEPK